MPETATPPGAAGETVDPPKTPELSKEQKRAPHFRRETNVAAFNILQTRKDEAQQKAAKGEPLSRREQTFYTVGEIEGLQKGDLKPEKPLDFRDDEHPIKIKDQSGKIITITEVHGLDEDSDMLICESIDGKGSLEKDTQVSKADLAKAVLTSEESVFTESGAEDQILRAYIGEMRPKDPTEITYSEELDQALAETTRENGTPTVDDLKGFAATLPEEKQDEMNALLDKTDGQLMLKPQQIVEALAVAGITREQFSQQSLAAGRELADLQKQLDEFAPDNPARQALQAQIREKKATAALAAQHADTLADKDALARTLEDVGNDPARARAVTAAFRNGDVDTMLSQLAVDETSETANGNAEGGTEIQRRVSGEIAHQIGELNDLLDKLNADEKKDTNAINHAMRIRAELALAQAAEGEAGALQRYNALTSAQDAYENQLQSIRPVPEGIKTMLGNEEFLDDVANAKLVIQETLGLSDADVATLDEPDGLNKILTERPDIAARVDEVIPKVFGAMNTTVIDALKDDVNIAYQKIDDSKWQNRLTKFLAENPRKRLGMAALILAAIPVVVAGATVMAAGASVSTIGSAARQAR